MMYFSRKKCLWLVSRVVSVILPPGEAAEQAVLAACLRLARLRMRGLSSYTRVLAAAAAARHEAALRFPGGKEAFEELPWSFGYCCPGPQRQIGYDPDGLMCKLPQQEMELLLLREGIGLSRAALLLELPEDLAASRYVWGKRHLAERIAEHTGRSSARELEEQILCIRIYAATRLMEGLSHPEISESFSVRWAAGLRRIQLQKAKKGLEAFFLGPPAARRATALAVVAVTVFVSVWGLASADYGTNPFYRATASRKALERETGGLAGHFAGQASFGMTDGDASLYALHYALSLVPEGFRLTEHYISSNVSHAYYSNEAEERILFSQQIAEEPVVGFDTEDPSLALDNFNGHPVAVQELYGLQKIYWYNGKYCYTLSTSLPRSTALQLARRASIAYSPVQQPRSDMLPLNSLPAQYTPYLARENGDVLFCEGEAPENLEYLTSFIKRCGSRVDGAVRLASFPKEGPALLADLQMRDGVIYYTLDSRRNTDPKKAFQSGEEYERIALETRGSRYSVLLYSSKYDKPLEVVSFQAEK